jgi:GNAT superfamily N-acetyltransferase
LQEVLERTIRRLWRVRRLLLTEQPLEPLRPRPVPAGVEVRRLGSDELDLLAPLVSRRRRSMYRRALARGRTCHAAFRDGEVVGYAWLSPAAERDLEGYPLALPRGVAYLWYVYVAPGERSSGVGSALTNEAQLLARAAGWRATWRLTDRSNAPTYRMMRKNAGDTQRLIGELVYRRILRRERVEMRTLEAPCGP